MNFEDYTDLRGVNFSLLKEMARSPRHYQHRLHHRRPDTPAMRFGRAVHCAVLEPDLFPVRWTLYDGRRSGNSWLEFVSVNADKSILTVDEYESVLAIRDAVRAHKVARRLLRWGKPELTLRWVDEKTRIRCKARLDWLAPGSTLVDLKTTRDIDNRIFGRVSERMLYPSQLAFYRRGLVANGHGPGPAYIIAVEPEAPFDVAVFEVTEDVLMAGDLIVHDLLHKVRECRRRRRWPGRYESAEPLDFPVWALPPGDAYPDIIEVLS